MPTNPLTAAEVLDRMFLDVRCRLLDVAATLDRLQRSPGAEGLANERRMQQIREAIDILNTSGTDRAERLQMLFSDSYIPHWIQGLKTNDPAAHLGGKAFQETV